MIYLLHGCTEPRDTGWSPPHGLSTTWLHRTPGHGKESPSWFIYYMVAQNRMRTHVCDQLEKRNHARERNAKLFKEK